MPEDDLKDNGQAAPGHTDTGPDQPDRAASAHPDAEQEADARADGKKADEPDTGAGDTRAGEQPSEPAAAAGEKDGDGEERVTAGQGEPAAAGEDVPVLEVQGELLEEGGAEEAEGGDEPAVSERERELERELADARAETEQRLDDLRRLKAEFENFRKRTQRDATAARASASSALVTRLLPVLDNFELAISSAEQSQDFEKMLKGVEMVFGELREVLRSEGVTEIRAEGEAFDPQRHEAVVAVQSDDIEPGTVVGVVRTGYELQGKVLRPAMVKVAQ